MTAFRIAGVSALLVLSGLVSGQAAEKVLQPGDDLRITVMRGRDVANVKDGSIGEKLAEFEPVVKIQNGSFNDFKGNRVCLIMMGEDTTRKGNWKVICRREFDADFLSGKTFEWVGEPFKEGFDHTLAKSGFDYDGYIVIIKNSEGKPAVTAQSKSSWTKDLEKAWGLQQGKEYDKTYFKN